MNATDVTLRDFLAAYASEEDIQKQLPRIALVEAVHDRGNGTKSVVMRLPEDSRQMARYMHADAMLRAREPLK